MNECETLPAMISNTRTAKQTRFNPHKRRRSLQTELLSLNPEVSLAGSPFRRSHLALIDLHALPLHPCALCSVQLRPKRCIKVRIVCNLRTESAAVGGGVFRERGAAVHHQSLCFTLSRGVLHFTEQAGQQLRGIGLI